MSQEDENNKNKTKFTTIVSMNNGSQPSFSVILQGHLTKSLCGLAVVHV